MSKINYNRYNKAFIPWYDESRINKKKKKLKTSFKKLKNIQKYADALNQQLPASEVWFIKKFKKEPCWPGHLTNQQFWTYIPDLINYSFKYVIEVDGSYHNKPRQIIRDRKKDIFYKSKNYKVFRVEAFSNKSYDTFIEDLSKYRLDNKHLGDEWERKYQSIKTTLPLKKKQSSISPFKKLLPKKAPVVIIVRKKILTTLIAP